MALGDKSVFIEKGAAISAATAGDKITFSVTRKMCVEEWGLIEAASGVTGAAVIALDRRITAGSDTGRVNAAGGTITLNASAQGDVVANRPSNLIADAGDQLIMEVTTLDTTNTSLIPYVELAEVPQLAANEPSKTIVTA